MSDDNTTGLPTLADPIAQELVEIDRFVQEHGTEAYHKEGKAARRLELLRAREAGTPAPARNGIDGRMAEIRKLMWNPDGSKGPYWSGPDSKRLQAEFATLAEAKASIVDAAKSRQSVAKAPAAATDTAKTLALQPKAIQDEWRADTEGHAITRARDLVNSIMAGLPDKEVAHELIAGFSVISEQARAAVIRELGSPPPSGIATTRTTVEGWKAFAAEMPHIAQAWGDRGPQKLAIVRERLGRVLRNAGAAAGEIERYWDSITPAERTSLIWSLSGSAGGT